MSDTKYDSVLVGWADDPKYNDNNELMSWSVRLKDNELKDMLDQYVTRRDEQGRGGNVYVTLFMSKNGKACARVFNPNRKPLRRSVRQRRPASRSHKMTFLSKGFGVYAMIEWGLRDIEFSAPNFLCL